MRVLRIVNRFNLGGPTYNAGNLTRYMDAETRLIGGSPTPEEQHSGFILDQMGVKYEEIEEMSRSIHPLHDLKAFWRILKIIREFKPDIVHTHAAKAGILGRLAASIAGVSVIVHTYHGHVFSGYFSPWKTRIVKAIERWLGQKTNAIVTISRLQCDEIVGTHHICPPHKAHIIPLGFDLERFSANQHEKGISFRKRFHIPSDHLVIGIIGRFAPVKNHQLFFDAIAALKTTKPFTAVVVGDGETRTHWEAYVAQHLPAHDQTRVVFTSWIQDMDVAMSGMDIVVLTSINEGTPVSLIEAQAARRAVISTDVGGVRDCVLDGQSGLIVKSFDPHEIAAAIDTLIADDGLRLRMGEAGYQHVHAHYSRQRLVNDMQDLYTQLLTLHTKP